MADEIVEGTQTEGTTEGTQTEGTTGNGYLTKPYLVRNLQTFWSKIKQYIKNSTSGFVNQDTVNGSIALAVSDKATKEDLASLETEVNSLADTVATKANQDALTAVETELNNKVNKDGDKVLSTYDFDQEYKDKLDNLKNATKTEDGLMSASDKQKLEGIEVGANKTVVETTIESGTDNPVTCRAIKAALANKVDKETDPVDPPDLEDSKLIQGYVTNEGSIVLIFPQNTKHLKIYAPKSDRPIEKVSLWDGSSLLFTNFRDENGNWAITIENPNGTGEQISFGESFDFYIESLETIGNPKYKPFILQVTRLNDVTTEVGLTITKIL